MAASTIVTRCMELKTFWAPRDKKFKEWYKLIKMTDELAQKGMESFVGNDPRSAYNLLLKVLNQKIPHRIPPEDLGIEEIDAAAKLSSLYDIAWDDIFTSYRGRGRYWLRDLIGFLLATGWYSVFAAMSIDGSRCMAEVWNPATVYQSWDNDLIECAHIFPLSKEAAKRMIARNGWKVRDPTSDVIVYDYWKLEDFYRVINAIALDYDEVKPETWEPKFKRIPIFTSPVGGLPDTGDILTGRATDWKEEIGQSFLAPNENIYKYWNKWWTFTLQLLRDTAQARTWEKSRGAERIINPETWYKRGAHFKMSPEDSIGFVVPPAIPVELRSSQLDMEAMMQRGGPSWAMYGDVKAQLSQYVMSQIAASMSQIIQPYHQGVIDCITDIDNFWLDMIKTQGYKPYGIGLPAELADKDIKITAEYEIRIPGDLIQRAQTARTLDPNFELAPERVMAELFPEVKNPIEELAKIEAAKAKRHPVNASIALIMSLREEARLLRKAKDIKGAELHEKAADKIESMLDVVEEEAAPERRAPGAVPGVVPPPSPTPPASV